MDDSPPLRPLLFRAAVVGVVFVLAPLLLAWAVPEVRDPATLRAYVHGFGVLAPVVFVLIQVAQVLVAPIPGQAVAVAGGYLFGPWWGAAYSLTGMAIGSTIAFALSRRYGRPYVSDLIGSSRLARFDAFVGRSGVPGVFLLFLVPGLPDDAVCFVAGVTTIRLRVLVVVAVVGRAPGVLFASFIGAGLAAGQFALALAVGGALVLVWGVGYYYRRRLLDTLDRYVGQG